MSCDGYFNGIPPDWNTREVGFLACNIQWSYHWFPQTGCHGRIKNMCVVYLPLSIYNIYLYPFGGRRNQHTSWGAVTGVQSYLLILNR